MSCQARKARHSQSFNPFNQGSNELSALRLKFLKNNQSRYNSYRHEREEETEANGSGVVDEGHYLPGLGSIGRAN